MPEEFVFGALSHETAKPIAKRILAMFRGKRLSIAHVVVAPDNHPRRIDLSTGQVLQPVDGSTGTRALVHISREEHSRQHPRDDKPKLVSLTFADNDNIFHFSSWLLEGCDHESWKHPYFSFDRGDTLYIKEKLPDAFKLTTIKVEGLMVNNPNKYTDAELKAHFDRPMLRRMDVEDNGALTVADLFVLLLEYNPYAKTEVIVHNQSEEFSLVFGGPEGVEKEGAESVSFYVDRLCDSEREAPTTEAAL